MVFLVSDLVRTELSEINNTKKYKLIESNSDDNSLNFNDLAEF